MVNSTSTPVAIKADIEAIVYGDSWFDYANEKPWKYRRHKLLNMAKSDIYRKLGINL